MTSIPAGPDLAELSDVELAEERDFLLRSLRDLDDERAAGDVDEGDYDVLKEGYTARAAAVLRELESRRNGDGGGEDTDGDGGGHAAAAEPGPHEGPRQPPQQPPPPQPRRPWWARGRLVAAGAGVALFAVGAGLLVAHSAGQRLPGQTV